MMPIIQQALLMGYTAKQVLNFISSKMPDMKQGLENSRKSGYSDEDILRFIQGKIKVDKNAATKAKNAQDRYLSEIGIKTKEEKQAQKAKNIKGALGAAALGLTAYRMYQNYSGLASDAMNLFGMGRGEQQGPDPQPEPMPGQQVEDEATAPVTEAMQPGQAPIPTPEGPEPTQPQQLITQPEELAVKGAPQNLFNKLTQGLDTEGLSPLRQRQLSNYNLLARQLEEQGITENDPQAKELKKKIKSLFLKKPTMAEEEMGRFEEGYEKPQKMEERKPKLELPSNPVLTSKGDIADLKSQNNKNALIQYNDGITKQVKADDIIKPPLPHQKLAKLYDDLISGIEEVTGQQVSRNVDLAGYDKDNNELTYTPHGGATYVYDDIPEDIVDELLSMLTRKTTGQNFVGAWEAGTESPIGAQMSALIKRLIAERRKSGKMEYSRKYEQIYDAFKPAIEAKKQVLKEKREEEKRRKKEAKKR